MEQPSDSTGPLAILRTLALLVVALATPCLAAPSSLQERGLRPPRVTLSVSEEGGLAEVGESVVFTATVINRYRETLKGTLHWRGRTVAAGLELPGPESVELEPRETRTFPLEVTLTEGGFVEVTCAFTHGEPAEERSARTRVGWSPAKVASPLTRAEDFDGFWAEALAELAGQDSATVVEARPDRDDERRRVFEVTLLSAGGVRVRGWLEVPRAEGPHPCLVRVPGYGSSMWPLGSGLQGTGEDLVIFSFNPRGHGNSQDDVSGQPQDYWIRGLDSPGTYYYRGAYLDCVRAIDFVVSRPEVDGERIAVWGGSQGGGFALATAALDQRVDLCLADIPFLCDWVNYFKLSDWPEMDGWIAASPERSWKKTLHTLSYFDTLNLAERVECPVLMGVGLQDRVCPPATSFAAFNRVPGEKTFHIYPGKAHGLDERHWSLAWRWLRSSFGLKVQGD